MPDDIDIQLLQALQLDGRAPFSLIAEVLGVSDQTIARRYNRLTEAGTLRVRGLSDPERLQHTRWIVRVQCIPAAASAPADALARRPDTSWISLSGGGTEITCAVRTDPAADDDRVLLQTLPRNRFVVGMTAQCILHTFFGDAAALITKVGPLSARQMARLRAPAPNASQHAVILSELDQRLLKVLERDGRATFAELAATAGASQTTVRRRVAELRENGTLYFDVDFDQKLLDLHVRAMLWMAVAPSELEGTGRALREHPETAFVAATSGATNLCMSVVCPDITALYTYLTTRVAALTAIEHVETVPIVRTIKRSGILSPA